MLAERIADYTDRIYAYALKRTFTEEEAADLSQEILYTALRMLPKLRDESKFEPWLWGIAERVSKTFARKMGKQRAMFSYDIPVDLAEEDTDDEIEQNEALYASLRRKIAMLASSYREIIILHYYEGLSVKQISDRLRIPEGTVTWRLSEARRKLKKELSDMEVSALQPKKLRLDIYGCGNYQGEDRPFPDVYINDALSQNILYHCYESAHGTEELAGICGVPAYYIEDRIENLIRREAMTEQTKGKYRTDFIIWSDKYGIYCEENAEKALMPVMDSLLDALGQIAEKASELDFYRAGKREAELYYLYGALAFDYIRYRYSDLPYPPIREKYDGYRWCYLGSTETGAHPRISVGVLHCGNNGSRGSYSHTVFCGFGGFMRREMMYDYQINACEDILLHGTTDDGYSAASAIQSGYIVKQADGRFFVTVPAFTREQKKRFDALTEAYLVPLVGAYTACIRDFIDGYKKLFPKHLHDDADRMCQNMFFSLYKVIAEYAQKTGAAEPIGTNGNAFCDVMLQFKDNGMPLGR